MIWGKHRKRRNRRPEDWDRTEYSPFLYRPSYLDPVCRTRGRRESSWTECASQCKYSNSHTLGYGFRYYIECDVSGIHSEISRVSIAIRSRSIWCQSSGKRR
jgi:hypothetical protein